MGWIVAFTLIFSMVISVPVGMSLGIATFIGMLYVSPDVLIMMPQKFLYGLDSFPLLAIPLFVMAGQLMSSGGIAKRIISMALIFVGRIYGGLAIVVIFSALLISGISGSPSANTAAIGSVAIPAMKRLKYPPEFATAVLAAAGGVSTLVPPAIDLIIIGVIANISIGGLFAAGIFPAIVNGVAIMIMAYYFSRKMNLPLAEKRSLLDNIRVLKDGILPILMIIIILGGIYGGIFTPTEAASVAVVYGFIVSFFIYKELKMEDLPTVLLNTAALSGVVLLVLATASMFSFILTFDRIPHAIAQFIVTYADNWILFIILVHIVFLMLGMIMDALPAIIVLMPIFVPVAVSLGMEPIHLGILVAANVGIGMITPPVGICLFVACGISKIPIGSVVKPLLPFLVFLVLTLVIITMFPQITLFLPRLLGFI
ncbi:MAG: TRAP transporter large permease [Candidatus Marinimicrobia bacterium]|jgi:C4-dicarboxylate transporter DctM subunit|nr:TRAP transporter large permease [Candidatus Neomarinimicrobiota bacterium]|tara:strand:- start:6413 stop:7693 length:1281 start_codon:yes stop_codon:yes gene_type:complete